MQTTAPSKLGSVDREKLAAEFLAGAKWRLVSSRGSSTAAAGSSRIRLRIAAAGCPRNSLREVHQMLAEKTPVVDPVVDGVVYAGTFAHRASWWTIQQGSGALMVVRELADGDAMPRCSHPRKFA